MAGTVGGEATPPGSDNGFAVRAALRADSLAV
jgi:hypothetical protein